MQVQSSNKKQSKNLLTSNAVLGPLIWAVDPKGKNTRSLDRLGAVAKQWGRLFNSVRTFSILYPGDFEWTALNQEALTKAIKEQIQKQVKPYIAKSGMSQNFQDIQFSETISRIKAADKFLEEARNQEGGAILIGSEAKKHQRTGLGSFAEILIGKSTVPVIIVGKKAEASSSQTILLPTDFSTASENAFSEILKWAKLAKLKIILYYQIDLTGLPIYASYIPGGAPLWIAETWDTERTEAKKLAESWVRKAAKNGVVCETYIEEKLGSFSDRVCKISKKVDAGLIAFGVGRSVWQQLLLGGDLREVFSEAKVPVVVFHSEKLV